MVTGEEEVESIVLPEHAGWLSLAFPVVDSPFLSIQDYQLPLIGALPENHALVIMIEPCDHHFDSGQVHAPDCVMKKSAVLLKMNGQPMDQVTALDSSGESVPLFFIDKEKDRQPAGSQALILSKVIISISPNESPAPESTEDGDFVPDYGYFSQDDLNENKKRRPSGSFPEYLFNQLDAQLSRQALLGVFGEWLMAVAIKPEKHYLPGRSNINSHERKNNFFATPDDEKIFTVKNRLRNSQTLPSAMIQLNMLYIPFASLPSPPSLPSPEHTVMTWVVEIMSEKELHNFFSKVTRGTYPLTLEQFKEKFIASGKLKLDEFYSYLSRLFSKAGLFKEIKRVLVQQRIHIPEPVQKELDKIVEPATTLKTSGSGIKIKKAKGVAAKGGINTWVKTESRGWAKPGEVPLDYIEKFSEVYGRPDASGLHASGRMLHDSSWGVTVMGGSRNIQVRGLSSTPEGATGDVYRKPKPAQSRSYPQDESEDEEEPDENTDQ